MNRSSVFAVLTILIIVSGCKFQNWLSRSDTNVADDGSPASDQVKRGSDPREDVIEALKKFTDLDSFSAKMTASGKSDLNMEIEYVSPDRYHVRSAGSVEFILIGKQAYMKADGSWKKFPGNLGDSIPKMRDAFTEEGLKSMKDFEFTGEEKVNGEDAYVYKYKGTTIHDSNAYTATLWVGKADGLPLQIEADYPAGGTLEKMTTTYDYKTRVSIEAPDTK